jgi:flagellar biosynthesis anti-sigma factor FlgM
MSISPIGSNSPITRLQGSKATETLLDRTSQDVSAGATDTVDISDSARYLSEIKKLPPIRADKVQTMKDLIASGQFETPDRVNGTVDKLLQELG